MNLLEINLTFEGVDFESDVMHLVQVQLNNGIYRGKLDDASGDWLIRAWQALPQKEAQTMATAVNQCLINDSPDIRAEAVRTLDMCPEMADPTILLDLAKNRFELFRGLRRSSDSPQVDRGRDFVQLTASLASGDRGRDFRRQMAKDPVYGMNVLAALTQDDADWVVSHANELLNAQIDPDNSRLNIVIFNLRKKPQQLTQLVTNLAIQKGNNGRLQSTIQAKIRDPQLQATLLAILQ